MELINFPAEIICEIASFLDVNSARKLENATGFEIPNYIFEARHKNLFKESLGEIKRIEYTMGFLNRKSHRRRYTQGNYYDVIYEENNVVSRKRVFSKSIIIIIGRPQYKQSLTSVVSDINLADYPRCVKISAQSNKIQYINVKFDDLGAHYEQSVQDACRYEIE
jgi:hypothetical protein